MRFVPIVRTTALLLSLASGGGCASADSVGPSAEAPSLLAGKVSVAAGSDGLSLLNQTERPVYFTAFERDLAARIQWAPCTSGSNCQVLVQGEHRVLPWASVTGYLPTKPTYLVYWWNTEVGPDGRARVANMQSVSVSR